ncbi:hypothetical protein OAD24_14830, partial [Pseudomonadales bacterium]|nr:hypothetical protein [Pseudomonadales bacterium]
PLHLISGVDLSCQDDGDCIIFHTSARDSDTASNLMTDAHLKPTVGSKMRNSRRVDWGQQTTNY